MPLNLIQNTAHPYFTPRVTEGDPPQGPSSSLSVNQISNSRQQPHSLNVLKQDVQDTEINSSKKTAQSGSVCVFEEIKDIADNCIGILANRKYETAAFPFVDKTPESISHSFCDMLSDKEYSESNFLIILQHLAIEDISITQILPKNFLDMNGKIKNEQYLKMTNAMKKLADKARQSENQMEKHGISNLIFGLNDLGNSKTSLGVSQWFPEGIIIDLSMSMIKKVDKTQNDIEELSKLFLDKKPQHLQQPSLPDYSSFTKQQTKRLLNSLSLPSLIKYNVIPLSAVLTTEQKNIINQQVQIYVALNNSKASYEVFYENPIGGAQAKVEINSVICDYSPITLKNDDTLKARWDIISGLVDMLKEADNEKNTFGHDLVKYNYLTLDMLEKNADTHHLKISLPAHIEQTLVNENEKGDLIRLKYNDYHFHKYISPELLNGRKHSSTSVCYSVAAIIAEVLGFDINNDCSNIPLANEFSEIIGEMLSGLPSSRPSLGDAIKTFTDLNSDMKHEIECEASGERTDFVRLLKFKSVS